MKELSFLMFLIALTAIFSAFISNIFRLNPSKQVFFYFPDSSRFNIIWGFVFYAGYGLIIAQSLWLRIGFCGLIVLLLVYLTYLYMLKSFLSGHRILMQNLFAKIVSCKLDAQKELDRQLKWAPYTAAKAQKIMGLAPFALERPELLGKRLQMFKNLQSTMTIKHSYLNTVIKNLRNALNIK